MVSSGGLYCNRGNCFWWGRGGGTSHPCCNFDGRCRLWEGPPPPMDHQQANQLTTHPSAWESILKLCGNPSLDRLLTNPSAFFRGRVAFRPKRPNPVNGVHFWCRTDFISIWPEFPLSIKIKSVLTQFLQVQRRNFTRG